MVRLEPAENRPCICCVKSPEGTPLERRSILCEIGNMMLGAVRVAQRPATGVDRQATSHTAWSSAERRLCKRSPKMIEKRKRSISARTTTRTAWGPPSGSGSTCTPYGSWRSLFRGPQAVPPCAPARVRTSAVRRQFPCRSVRIGASIACTSMRRGGTGDVSTRSTSERPRVRTASSARSLPLWSWLPPSRWEMRPTMTNVSLFAPRNAHLKSVPSPPAWREGTAQARHDCRPPRTQREIASNRRLKTFAGNGIGTRPKRYPLPVPVPSIRLDDNRP